MCVRCDAVSEICRFGARCAVPLMMCRNVCEEMCRQSVVVATCGRIAVLIAVICIFVDFPVGNVYRV